MTALVYAALLLAAPAPGRHDTAELARRILAVTGSAGILDPRLDLPHCPAPEIAAAGDSARVRCPTPSWTLYVPLRAPAMPVAVPVSPPAPPVVRRGDPVIVESAGTGYLVTLKAIADADARDGRVWVKAEDGRRRLASIAPDGRLTLRH